MYFSIDAFSIKLQCAACLLYPPTSRPRVHIDVRRIHVRFSSACVAHIWVHLCASARICPAIVVDVIVIVVVAAGDFRIASDRKESSIIPVVAQTADVKKGTVCPTHCARTAIAKIKVYESAYFCPPLVHPPHNTTCTTRCSSVTLVPRPCRPALKKLPFRIYFLPGAARSACLLLRRRSVGEIPVRRGST